MKDIAHIVTAACLLVTVACDHGPDTNPRAGVAPTPHRAAIAWDDPSAEVQHSRDSEVARAKYSATEFSRQLPARGIELIWHRLSAYRDTFLGHWRQAFATSEVPEASEVADALDELLIAVTGPSGFWRKTVAGRWLGCEDDRTSEPCVAFAELALELTNADAMQHQLEALEPRNAERFLAKNQDRILACLDAYVPGEPNAVALKATPLYRKHLARALDQRIGQTDLSKNDL